jgi:hypothetical protein
MYVLGSNFDTDTALSKVSELLALGETPERLAEKLNLAQDLGRVQDGIKGGSFKRLISDVEKLRRYLELGQDIDKHRGGQTLHRLLGSGFKEKTIQKLESERRKMGSIYEPPRWYYQHPRVWLLGAIKDYALDLARHHDSDWLDTDEEPEAVQAKSIDMFEHGNVALAKELSMQLEKPFKDLEPKFVLESLDGHRSFAFHFQTQRVTYFQPIRES